LPVDEAVHKRLRGINRKHHELPERSYTTLDELVAAVRRALRRDHRRLRPLDNHYVRALRGALPMA
jgi:hypothetical protein